MSNLDLLNKAIEDTQQSISENCDRQPNFVYCLPDFWEAYQKILNAPLWKRIFWKLTFGRWPE